MVAFIFALILLVIGATIGFVCIKCRNDYDGATIGAVVSFSLGSVLFIVLMLVACLTSVSTGHTGVATKFGQVQDYTLDSGLHSKAPWIKVIEMDNRVQKATVDMEAFSSDIQEVKCKYTLNYQISKDNAQTIYKTIGKDYYNNVITPNIAQSVKTATAAYSAETLISNRTQLAEDIEELLTQSLMPYNIEVVSTSVEDLDFTDSFTAAVEAKQVADQNKKKASIEQEQMKIEAEAAAERARITAKNEADIAIDQAERAKIKAEADALVAQTKANAEAEVARIQAQADMEVAKIGADSAEYQGKKEASIAMQRLASINGWTVVTNPDTDINELYKADGTRVTDEELKVGSANLIKYYYTTQWNGILPETYVGDGAASTIILGNAA